jgi:DNA-binding transcriptional regulator YdaS (Cro superfamily)
MLSPVYLRAIRRACDIAGGDAALAAVLRISPDAIKEWLHGDGGPPENVFLMVVDLIIEHDIQTERDRPGPKS